MTRKDYIAIAAAIRATQDRIRIEAQTLVDVRKQEYADRFQPDQRAAIEHSRDVQLRGVRRTAAHIADALKEDNPAGFDPSLFLKNCGYGATTMNPRDPALDLRPLPGEEIDSRKAWAQREETERLPRRFPGGAQSGWSPN